MLSFVPAKLSVVQTAAPQLSRGEVQPFRPLLGPLSAHRALSSRPPLGLLTVPLDILGEISQWLSCSERIHLAAVHPNLAHGLGQLRPNEVAASRLVPPNALPEGPVEQEKLIRTYANWRSAWLQQRAQESWWNVFAGVKTHGSCRQSAQIRHQTVLMVPQSERVVLVPPEADIASRYALQTPLLPWQYFDLARAGEVLEGHGVVPQDANQRLHRFSFSADASLLATTTKHNDLSLYTVGTPAFAAVPLPDGLNVQHFFFWQKKAPELVTLGPSSGSSSHKFFAVFAPKTSPQGRTTAPCVGTSTYDVRDPVLAIAAAKKGRTVVVFHNNGTINRVALTKDGAPVAYSQTGLREVVDVKCQSRSGRALLLDANKTVYLWQEQHTKTITQRLSDAVEHCALGADGLRAVVLRRGQVELFDVVDGVSRLLNIRLHMPILSVSLSKSSHGLLLTTAAESWAIFPDGEVSPTLRIPTLQPGAKFVDAFAKVVGQREGRLVEVALA